MPDDYLAIQVVMMPRDTNPLGSIFGGVILSYIDQAGAIGARREVVRAGGVHGLHVPHLADHAFDNFVVDRMQNGHRIYLRPKVPFGA